MVTMVSGALATSQPIHGVRLGLSMFATACVVGAANAFNMWMERDSDALMSRTRKRPLPTGRLSPEIVVGFGTLLAVVGLTLLAFYYIPTWKYAQPQWRAIIPSFFLALLIAFFVPLVLSLVLPAPDGWLPSAFHDINHAQVERSMSEIRQALGG